MGISEDALAMKAYIEEHGWVQNSYGGPEGVCIIGSLSAIRYGDYNKMVEREYNEAYDLTYLAIRDYLDVDFIGSGWNDDQDRTKQEVLDMLNDVAIKHQPDEMRSNPDEDK